MSRRVKSCSNQNRDIPVAADYEADAMFFMRHGHYCYDKLDDIIVLQYFCLRKRCSLRTNSQMATSMREPVEPVHGVEACAVAAFDGSRLSLAGRIDQYELTTYLGGGAAGVVYEAFHTQSQEVSGLASLFACRSCIWGKPLRKLSVFVFVPCSASVEHFRRCSATG